MSKAYYSQAHRTYNPSKGNYSTYTDAVNTIPAGRTREVTRGALRVAPPNTPRQVVTTPTDRAFDVLGTAAGAVGSASALFPALAPVAAVGGVGYGIYKLGKSFDLW